MDKIIEIRFGKSNSKFYSDAIEIAKGFSDFTEINDTLPYNVIKTDPEELHKKFHSYEALYTKIYGWQNASIIYEGNKVQMYQFHFNLCTMLKCSQNYRESVVKKTWCNLSNTEEGWGCKLLVKIRRHLSSNKYQNPWDYWYRYGSFESEKAWKLNKLLIKDELNKEAEEKKIKYCPFFSIEKVYNKVDELPDVIPIEEGSGWEIEFKDDFVGTTVQKRPVGIKYEPVNEGTNNSDGVSLSLSSILDSIVRKETKKEDNTRLRFIPETTYNNIGGIDDIIDQIREVIELPLKRPDLYLHLGIKPHKGILLYGEPGCGKTLIAQAIANEVKAHFIPVSGSELISKYIGESEKNLREIFKEARELKPSIIFFDEIDSVAQRRSDDEMNRHEAKFVNQLLTLMDGMEEYDNVTVLASTNRPELLDEALLRPGRFDFKIEIHRPNSKGCLKILKIHTKKMPLDVSLDLNQVVPMIGGCSGAEIAFIVKEAGLNALKRSVDIKDLITEESYTNLDPKNIHVTFEDFKQAVAELKDNTFL